MIRVEDKDLYYGYNTKIVLDQSDWLKTIMILCFFSYIDFLMAIFGCANNFDDRHGCSINIVYLIDFLFHSFEDILNII